MNKPTLRLRTLPSAISFLPIFLSDISHFCTNPGIMKFPHITRHPPQKKTHQQTNWYNNLTLCYPPSQKKPIQEVCDKRNNKY